MNDLSRSAVPRIALCAAGELFGGVERHVLDLASAWRDSTGEAPLLVLFHEAETAARAREAGLDPLVLVGRQKYDPAPGRGLGDVLKQKGVDVVHAHGYRAAVTCLLSRRRHRFAVVKTEHGKVESGNWRNTRGLKLRLNSMADVWATRRLDAEVCYVTDDLRRHFDKLHGGLSRRTIPNGIVPLDRSDRARPAELEAGYFNFVIAGRMAPVKGIDQALTALSLVDPREKLRLVIIGDGPAAAELKDLAGSLGVDDRVRFLGFRRDVYDFLAHADALLMPSLHEGLPYTLLEAMSLGAPVLASRVGGLAEVLQDGITGLLFPAADPEALRNACLRIAGDPDLARRIGVAAAVEQRSRFTLDGMLAGYRAAYTKAARSLRDS